MPSDSLGQQIFTLGSYQFGQNTDQATAGIASLSIRLRVGPAVGGTSLSESPLGM